LQERRGRADIVVVGYAVGHGLGGRRCWRRAISKTIRSVLPAVQVPFRWLEFSRPTASTSSLFLFPVQGRETKKKEDFY